MKVVWKESESTIRLTLVLWEIDLKKFRKLSI